MNTIDTDFITKVESQHFRTEHDTGANRNAMFIWNLVRRHVGLDRIRLEDLPAWCETHRKYHVIQLDYGCARSVKKSESRLSST